MKKIVVLVFLLFGMGLVRPVFADDFLTLSDFRRACKDQSVLSTNPFYPDSVWNNWINEAGNDLSGYGIIEKLDTLFWVEGTTIYSLNADFIELLGFFALRPVGKRVLNVVSAKDVGQVSVIEIECRDVWQTGKGGSAIIGFFPPPVVKDTFLVIYGAGAEYMDSDTDTTEIPYSYRPLIIDYVVYRALLRDGKEVDSDRYYKSYMARLEIKLKFDQKRFDVFTRGEE